jgi:hypothetical protein
MTAARRRDASLRLARAAGRPDAVLFIVAGQLVVVVVMRVLEFLAPRRRLRLIGRIRSVAHLSLSTF